MEFRKDTIWNFSRLIKGILQVIKIKNKKKQQLMDAIQN